MELLVKFLVDQKDDLGNLLNALHDHNDGSPPFQFLTIYGKFIYRFSNHIQSQTESDALDLAIADITNDPIVQQLVAAMVGKKIDQGLGL